MATLVAVVTQSAVATAGTPKSATTSSAAMTTARTIVPRSRRGTSRLDAALSPEVGAAVTRSRPGPRDGDDAVPRQEEQRSDREHERRRGAVRGDRGVRGGDGLCEADGEAAEQRRPERLEPTDQRGRERGDHEERQRRVVERREQVREEQAGSAAREPGAEPRGRLDAAYRHAQRCSDLPVVGERPHRRAELRDAQEDAGGGGDREGEHDRDELRQARRGAEDVVAVLRAR